MYNEIYNPQNKWDKDYQYYRAFDADESFFSQTHYRDARHGRSLIANLFSKRAISELQHLIRDQVKSDRSRFVRVSVLIGSLAGSIQRRSQRAIC